jgi:hypothetical protein
VLTLRNRVHTTLPQFNRRRSCRAGPRRCKQRKSRRPARLTARQRQAAAGRTQRPCCSCRMARRTCASQACPSSLRSKRKGKITATGRCAARDSDKLSCLARRPRRSPEGHFARKPKATTATSSPDVRTCCGGFIVFAPCLFPQLNFSLNFKHALPRTAWSLAALLPGLGPPPLGCEPEADQQTADWQMWI